MAYSIGRKKIYSYNNIHIMNILNTFQYHINNILNYHLKKYLKKKKLSLKTNIQCKINKNSTLILINKETLTLSPSNNNNSNNNK